MNPLASEHGAKEFLISRIVEEARSAGIPLSEVERKMLYFSETGWTLPDIMQVNEQFDLSYGMEEYEKKIADLAGKAAQRAQEKVRMSIRLGGTRSNFSKEAITTSVS